MNTKSSLVSELRNKEYRESFVASEISIGLPFQIRALRKSRGLRQPDLAKLAGMSQPRISEIETPGARNLSLDTLQRIASAFDVALQVRFIPFARLVSDSETIDLETFSVPSFEEELTELENSMECHPSAIYDSLCDTSQSRKVIAFDFTERNSTQAYRNKDNEQAEGARDGSLSSIAS